MLQSKQEFIVWNRVLDVKQYRDYMKKKREQIIKKPNNEEVKQSSFRKAVEDREMSEDEIKEESSENSESLESLHKQYQEKFGKKVWPRFSNNAERIKNKLSN